MTARAAPQPPGDGSGTPIAVPFRGMAGYDDDLRFAHVLADAADDITARRFRAADLRVETKPDLTPVTDADHATEDSLRNVLRRARPRDAMLGEEAGRSGSGARCWVIDPIDATKNYVRGVPVWATLIGLMDGDEVVVGVVSAPALSRRWWAARGGGAWTGRGLTKATRCRVSEVAALQEVSLWDLAALQVIVEEAGGIFTDLAGNATPAGGSAVCTNGLLHGQVLEWLAAGS